MTKSVKDIRFCKLDGKLGKSDRKDFENKVSAPRFMCKKCFRVSSDKGNLCKPEKLGK